MIDIDGGLDTLYEYDVMTDVEIMEYQANEQNSKKIFVHYLTN